MPSVFLSHSHGDKPFVRDLAGRLTQAGAAVWLDEAGMRDPAKNDKLQGRCGAGRLTSCPDASSAWPHKRRNRDGCTRP